MRVLRSISVVLLALSLLPAFAQPTRQRLVLKDGSYQVVTKYEVKGDRVRYQSAERGGDWEEVPYSLIDWPATEKWNKEHVPGASSSAAAADGSSPAQNEAAQIDKEEQTERADELARMPFVASGLRIPDESGVFVLDTFQAIPELVHIDQSNGDLNRSAGHNVLRAAINPMGGAKQLVQIQGANAKVQVHVAEPVLYVSLDGGEDAVPDSALAINTHGASSVKDKNSFSSPDSKYAIVRVESRKNLRVIGAVRVSMLGKVSQSEDIIPTNIEILPGKRWMKVTPKHPLSFGEYALVEILSPGEINLDVWDFGVNPRAPENKGAYSPVQTGAR